MVGSKLVVLMVVFIFAGISFLMTGVLFMRQKYTQKLLESVNDEQKGKMAVKMAKTCSLVSISLGVWTMFTGFVVIFMPQLFNAFSLIYIFVLIIAVSIISYVLKAGSFDNK